MPPLLPTASFDDLGVPPLNLRNGAPAAKSGWLVRGRLSGRRKFFILRGAVLTQTDSPPEDFPGVLVRRNPRLQRTATELDPTTERFCIFNTVVEQREPKLSIILPKLKLYLVAPDRTAYKEWVEAIHSASQRCLDDFYVLKESHVLGVGSFGRVCRGYELQTRDPVAIKVVEKENCSERELRQAGSEAAIVMTVGHRHVVKTNDIFETDKALYIVMELMENSVEGLMTEMRIGKRLFPEDVVRDIIKPIAEAISELHSMGIVHRDIKPDNILVKRRKPPYAPKLCDFGFGAFVGIDDVADMALRGTIGTSVYLAPEVVLNNSYGRPVDMWALGINIYELVSGVTPFDAATVGEVVRSIRDSQVQFDQPVWDDVSYECKSLILQLLEKDPSARLTAPMMLLSPWFRDSDRPDPALSSDEISWSLDIAETVSFGSSHSTPGFVNGSAPLVVQSGPASLPGVPFSRSLEPVLVDSSSEGPDLYEQTNVESEEESSSQSSHTDSYTLTPDAKHTPLVRADDSLDSTELEEERQNLRSWLKGRRTAFEKPREEIFDNRVEVSKDKRLSLRGSFMRTSLVSEDTHNHRRSVEDIRDEQFRQRRRKIKLFARKSSGALADRSSRHHGGDQIMREALLRKHSEKRTVSNSNYDLDGEFESVGRPHLRTGKSSKGVDRSGSVRQKARPSSATTRQHDSTNTPLGRLANKHAKASAMLNVLKNAEDTSQQVETGTTTGPKPIRGSAKFNFPKLLDDDARHHAEPVVSRQKKDNVSMTTRQSIMTKIAKQTAKSGSLMFGIPDPAPDHESEDSRDSTDAEDDGVRENHGQNRLGSTGSFFVHR